MPSAWRWAATAALAFLVLLVAATTSWSLPFYRAAHGWVVAHRVPAVVSVASVVTNLGASWVAIPLVALVAALVTRRVRRVVAVVAVLAGGVLVRSALAAVIARARPPHADWAVQATGSSFPSGHSATAALAAGLVVWLTARPAIAWVAVGCALLVGCTRFYLGVHWPTDVLGGWAFAAAWLTTAAAIVALRRKRIRDGNADHEGHRTD